MKSIIFRALKKRVAPLFGVLELLEQFENVVCENHEDNV